MLALNLNTVPALSGTELTDRIVKSLSLYTVPALSGTELTDRIVKSLSLLQNYGYEAATLEQGVVEEKKGSSS